MSFFSDIFSSGSVVGGLAGGLASLVIPGSGIGIGGLS